MGFKPFTPQGETWVCECSLLIVGGCARGGDYVWAGLCLSLSWPFRTGDFPVCPMHRSHSATFGFWFCFTVSIIPYIPYMQEGIRGQTHWNHTHRKLVNLITLGTQPCLTQWWRDLTECGQLEKGMANHFSILALRTPWTVWKGKMIGYWKRNSPGQ